MKIVITGGGGFIGRRLAKCILAEVELTGPSGRREPITELVLFDAVSPPKGDLADDRSSATVGDITDVDMVSEVINQETDSVFHLAAVVSAGAEADFALGYKVNLQGSRNE